MMSTPVRLTLAVTLHPTLVMSLASTGSGCLPGPARDHDRSGCDAPSSESPHGAHIRTLGALPAGSESNLETTTTPGIGGNSAVAPVAGDPRYRQLRRPGKVTPIAWAARMLCEVMNLAERDAAVAAVPRPQRAWCLFLDVDGTLLELADAPDAVEVDLLLLPLLERLRVAAGGAVALVSGRTIAGIDALLGTGNFPVAGVHGCQRRDVHGQLHAAPIACDRLSELRDALDQIIASHPKVLIEDKGAGLALHYAKAPEMHDRLREEVEQLAARIAPGFVTVRGRSVIEVRPAGHTKGSAITAYMSHAPFANRMPIFIGDDLTDYDGFEAVNRYGGLAIAVGPRVRSQWWLPGPAAVRSWLEELLKRS